MSGALLASLGFVAMLGLIALRAPIGLAMLLVGGIGYCTLSSWNALFGYMKTNTYHQFANYTLSVIPLFILMGALAERAGIARALFLAAERAVGRRRGGLAMAVIGACTAFGAICGSSVATTATFGRAAMPELDRHGYDRGFSSATIAVGGTLGILIPPSVILVVYAITTEQNIAKLFQAALIPGVLAAAFYCIAIALMVKREPALAPLAPPDAAIPTVRRPAWQKAVAGAIVALAGALWLRGTIGYDFALVIVALAFVVALVDVTVLPAITVAVVVVGGIYGGIFTPTEGASVGAVAMLGVGLAQRSLGWREIVDAVRQTAETSGMIFMILLGAEVFGAFLALARLPTAVADFVGGMGVSPYIVLVAMLAIYILLGAVMDELAMILLTLPVFFPIVQALDFGMTPDDVAIWFGILVLIVVGIGLTAPPIGLNVFVISAITRNVPIEQTYRRVLPFIAADVLRLALVVAVPGLALWLVRFFA